MNWRATTVRGTDYYYLATLETSPPRWNSGARRFHDRTELVAQQTSQAVVL